jgi:hypothetical protein
MLAASFTVSVIGIHFGNNVIRMSFVSDNALIMNGDFRANVVKKFIANIMASISAGFVTE